MGNPEILFILYKPAVPGNIGASARAIKTMGFSELRLISPCDHLGAEARMLAHGANEILEKAKVFSSFEKSVEDADLIIATTSKKRSAKVDYIPVRDLPGLILEKGNTVKKTAILFGTEESGLPNELIRKADLAMTIPLMTDYPSLNLSQAVMITAYELSPLFIYSSKDFANDKEIKGWKELRERTTVILKQIGIPEGSPLFHRILERTAMLGETDLNLLHSVTAKLFPLLKDNIRKVN